MKNDAPPPEPPLFEEALGKFTAVFDEIAGKVDRLRAPKWCELWLARAYVTGWLLGQAPSTEAEQLDIDQWEVGQMPRTEFGFRYTVADQESRDLLVRLLGSGELEARAIVHAPDAVEPVLCEPLGKVWWRRVVQLYDPYLSKGDEFPIHALDWAGSIRRCRPVRPDYSDHIFDCDRDRPLRSAFDDIAPESVLATVTDIEVDRLALLRIVEPPKGADPTTVAVSRGKTGPRPNLGRITANREAAERVVAKTFGVAGEVSKLWGGPEAKRFIEKKFEKLDGFYAAVAQEAGATFNEGTHRRQFRRDLFGEA